MTGWGQPRERSLVKVTYVTGLIVGLALGGCTANTAPDEGALSKDEARERGGKSDHGIDYCEIFGWYGDGVCDDFCVLADPDCEDPPPADCYVGGCSSQVCGDIPGIITTCDWREEYACYRDATCERQPDGECGWTPTPELRECLDNSGPVPTEPCYVGGCSSQVCSDIPGVVTTCDWREEYACYRDAACERQPDGECGWTATPELRECLDNGGPIPVAPCYVGGCSRQVCSDIPGLITTCEWRPEYACYRDATCARQPDGVCGWTPTPELDMCLGAS
jgi:hypothetical protein